MTGRIKVDKYLECEINQIMESFKMNGYRSVSRPDVIRLLVRDYKTRQPKIVKKGRRKNDFYLQ